MTRNAFAPGEDSEQWWKTEQFRVNGGVSKKGIESRNEVHMSQDMHPLRAQFPLEPTQGHTFHA